MKLTVFKHVTVNGLMYSHVDTKVTRPKGVITLFLIGMVTFEYLTTTLGTDYLTVEYDFASVSTEESNIKTPSMCVC